MELERRIAVFTSALVLGLLVCICVTLGGTILKYEEARLTRDLKAVQALFTQLQDERFRSLEAETKLLSDLPQLKAVMSTNDAPTIVDAFDGFRGLIHADFLDGFDENDHPYDQKSKPALETMVKRVREAGKPEHGYVVDGEQLKQVVAIPVRNGDRAMGTLVVGYRFGEDVLTKLQDMTRGEFALVGEDALVFQATKAATAFLKSNHEGQVGFGTAAVLKTLEPFIKEPGSRGDYIVALTPLAGTGGEPVGKLISMRAVSEGMQIANRLRTNMIVLSTVFCFLAIAISFLFARSISRPLRNLSTRLGAADPADPESLKRITDSSDGIGADRDVQSMLASFSHLVKALSTERERSEDSIAQHTQHLEGQIESLKLQSTKLADANRRLLQIISTGPNAALVDKDAGAA